MDSPVLVEVGAGVFADPFPSEEFGVDDPYDLGVVLPRVGIKPYLEGSLTIPAGVEVAITTPESGTYAGNEELPLLAEVTGDQPLLSLSGGVDITIGGSSEVIGACLLVAPESEDAVSFQAEDPCSCFRGIREDHIFAPDVNEDNRTASGYHSTAFETNPTGLGWRLEWVDRPDGNFQMGVKYNARWQIVWDDGSVFTRDSNFFPDVFDEPEDIVEGIRVAYFAAGCPKDNRWSGYSSFLRMEIEGFAENYRVMTAYPK